MCLPVMARYGAQGSFAHRRQRPSGRADSVPNGAGKLRRQGDLGAAANPSAGTIVFDGHDITPAFSARHHPFLGWRIFPEGRHVFSRR